MEEVKIRSEQIELVPISTPIPYDKNMHIHTDEQIDRLVQLIEYQGFRAPLILQKGTNRIAAGHGRLMAAKKMGMEKVPVVYQEFENEEQFYSFVVSDNAIGKDSWASLDLSQINKDIIDLGPYLDIDMLGLKDFVVEPVEKFEPQGDEDAVPELKEDPITKRGNIWLLGNHRVMCGDSTMIDDVEKLMNGGKADMVFTSPPYNIGKNGFEDKGKYENDKDDRDSFRSFLNDFSNTWSMVSCYQFVNLQFVSKNKIDLIEWCYDQRSNFIDIISCKKDTTLPAMEKNILNADFEHVYVFGESNRTRHIKLGKEFRGTLSNVVEMKRNRKKVSKDHRAGFDVSFPMHFIDNFTSVDKVIADPFMGTGTTLIACEKTNRKCYGMELDEHYCDVIVNRWQQYTGKKAVLESNNKTYDELKNDSQG